jgi:diguanylate cyclase (GGDEF)-like protein
MHEVVMFVRGGKEGRAITADDVRHRRADAGPAGFFCGQADQSARPYLPNRLFHIPSYWVFMAPTMALAGLPAFACARGLPGAGVLVPAVAAVLLCMVTPLFTRVERHRARGSVQRALVMLPGVGLPMLLYGWAASAWAHEEGSALWIGAAGMVTLAGAAASLLLARRSPAMLVALAGVWLPLVIASGRSEVWLIFAFGVFGGGLLVVRQARIYEDAMAKRRELQLVQERAFDILVDYEKTGQCWFWETDRDGAITYLSPKLSEVFGCPAEALYGRPFVELFGLDVTGNETAATGLNLHFSARTVFRDVLVSVSPASEERWWSISGSPIHDRLGDYFGFRGFGWDQTEKRRSQEHSSRLAHYDSLTGVANRLQMSQSLETILNAPDEGNRSCALVLIDLDRFKQINDTLGHPAGDDVLRQAAQRLRQIVDGAGRVGRVGGDEFQVILPGSYTREHLAVLAHRIVESLGRPYAFDNRRAVIGASLGIALAPADGVTSEALVRNADLALYAAKDGGRGRYRFYTPDLHSDAEERRQLLLDLREAVAKGGLELWYPSVIHTQTQAITGFEALLRWDHPRLGRLAPGRFLSIAEEAGLITAIGEWTLRTACNDLANWPESVRVAINLSPLQFANPSLPAIVTNALASAQVAPARLDLEITESVFLNEDSSTETMFAALKRIGVRLVLDDFGAGHSSLGYLEAAPFDCIKIDQTLLRGAIVPGSRNGAILASIIGLANALGMETTAEGVETRDELDLARMLGCSHVQGYVYEAPMNLKNTVMRLAKGMTAHAREARCDDGASDDPVVRAAPEAGGQRPDAAGRAFAIGGR